MGSLKKLRKRVRELERLCDELDDRVMMFEIERGAKTMSEILGAPERLWTPGHHGDFSTYQMSPQGETLDEDLGGGDRPLQGFERHPRPSESTCPLTWHHDDEKILHECIHQDQRRDHLCSCGDHLDIEIIPGPGITPSTPINIEVLSEPPPLQPATPHETHTPINEEMCMHAWTTGGRRHICNRRVDHTGQHVCSCEERDHQ